MSSILDDFKKLSNVRIGSFGKFIFNNSILNASNNRKLERKHSNFADFVLNGVNTGVKTTRKDLFNRIKELKMIFFKLQGIYRRIESSDRQI